MLRPGATWRLATDWQEYAIQMREVIEADGRFENLHPGPWPMTPSRIRAGRRAGRAAPDQLRAQGQEAGRTPRDLTYRFSG